jgi:hypothetical protein
VNRIFLRLFSGPVRGQTSVANYYSKFFVP